MVRNFKNLIYSHIETNTGIYFLVILFFVVGVSGGAFTVKALGDVQRQELMNYMKNFFYVLDNNKIEGSMVLKQSIMNNFQTIILMWLLGITIIGIPFILIIVLIRGLVVGFTISFIIRELGIRGIAFSAVSILPQNLIIIPSIIIVAVLGISFGKTFVQNKFLKYNHNKYSPLKKIIAYSSLVCFIFFLTLFGCIIEAYVSPVLMGLLTNSVI
ncbi:MAG: stage II sporulation protein M [Anaeromicrobium sp.]|jgi:stage II sporulation protein M|uniref:stage II sporulation protein M n=1 Tax=Anaeromicrobium sp. TaxID=1929132 RepID=UPI0025DE0B3C|nr:stage II sporulation protein M [Anaeromicrobium sp.]MCT4594683.1 stage II sporulation protein M [Anaeromicrobium sp.]